MPNQHPESDSIDHLMALVTSHANRRVLCQLATGPCTREMLAAASDHSPTDLDQFIAALLGAGIAQQQRSAEGMRYVTTDLLRVERVSRLLTLRLSNSTGEFVAVQFPDEKD